MVNWRIVDRGKCFASYIVSIEQRKKYLIIIFHKIAIEIFFFTRIYVFFFFNNTLDGDEFIKYASILNKI